MEMGRVADTKREWDFANKKLIEAATWMGWGWDISAVAWISFFLFVNVAFTLCTCYPANLQATRLQYVRILRFKRARTFLQMRFITVN